LIFCRQKRKKRERKEIGGKLSIEAKRRGDMKETRSTQGRKKLMLKSLIQQKLKFVVIRKDLGVTIAAGNRGRGIKMLWMIWMKARRIGPRVPIDMAAMTTKNQEGYAIFSFSCM
jgi:hypothetical protein